jgi:hypothetical protein
MNYGLILGAFWVFRYLFLVVAEIGVSDRFKFLFYLMNIVTLLLMYIFYYTYKSSGTGNPKGGIHCILFMIMMCFYASFLEGAIIYAHYKFIDPAYFSNLVSITVSGADSMPKTGLIPEENYVQIRDRMIAICSSKITYIVFEFAKNIFLGLFLSVILNFVVSIKKN